MEVVRNSINILGLTDENNLPDRVHGQIIQYAETDTIFIGDNQPEVSSIFQVIIKVSAHESRKIKTPIGYTVVLDGIKNIKIIYAQKCESGKANFMEIALPFNTYVEIPYNTIINNINIYILDAYFDLLDERKVYSHILYLIDVVTNAIPIMANNISQNQSEMSMNTNDNTIKGVNLNIPVAEHLQSDETGELKIDLEAEYL